MKTSGTETIKSHVSAYTAEVLMHVLAWLFVFSTPLIFNHGQSDITLSEYLRWCFMPLMVFVTFYVNYFVLVPRLFMRNRRLYYIVAAVFIAVMVTIIHIVCVHIMPHPQKEPEPNMPGQILFVFRDCVTMTLVTAFGFTSRLSHSWHKAERARKEAELGKKNAELKNLRNQINPHFLLNTLNNIYALTMIDSTKAQDAIQELSRLLRYLLYDNQAQFTQLTKERDFLESYINLMRMRTASDVETNIRLSVPDDSNIMIAPLLFISLVENAFKHGVSLSEKSFVNITLEATSDGVVDFYCENSNFPKNGRELSPGGIGLQNLAQRLDNLYSGHYHWHKGVSEDGKTYSSHLIIRTQ